MPPVCLSFSQETEAGESLEPSLGNAVRPRLNNNNNNTYIYIDTYMYTYIYNSKNTLGIPVNLIV